MYASAARVIHEWSELKGEIAELERGDRVRAMVPLLVALFPGGISRQGAIEVVANTPLVTVSVAVGDAEWLASAKRAAQPFGVVWGREEVDKVSLTLKRLDIRHEQ